MKLVSSFLAGGLIGGAVVASNAIDSQVLIYLAAAVAVAIAVIVLGPLLTSSQTAPNTSKSSPSNTSAASGPRETGTVKWFNGQKGFGFISRDTGDEVFVHFRAIRGRGNRYLVQGQRVEFSVATEDKGLRAEDVVVVNA